MLSALSRLKSPAGSEVETATNKANEVGLDKILQPAQQDPMAIKTMSATLKGYPGPIPGSLFCPVFRDDRCCAFSQPSF